ncbi:hypothetical protein FACS1894181_01400 [Bacteroidia bacterium]|nr:hypothetical protein FACS1894181_01400 [Bacteroidia bacterium]
MKISIVTPSYNQGQFIEDAILSVLNQNYLDFEHIIIDGGSSDNTLDVLKRYPHLKWMSEPDEGQSDALNKGFMKATGDIIGWLNSDDYYLPNIFDKVYNNLKSDSVDAIYSNCIFVDKQKNYKRNLLSHRPIRWLSLFHCYIPSTTFFFKRKIIDSGISIDKTFHIAMDKDFFANIFYSGYKVNYFDDFFAFFRWHDNNKSIDSIEVQKIRYSEGLRVLNKHFCVKIPINFFTTNLYKFHVKFFLIIRFFLKKMRKLR